MALTRWDPFAEIARLQDQLFRGYGLDMPRREAGAFAPAVDIYEEKDAYFVKAELPGVKAEDVHVSVENGVLTLKGERKFEREEKRENYHRIERSYGEFTRSFSLPKTVDAENVRANMAEGVLTLTIPKKAAPEPKRIQVGTGASTKPAGKA
jgi:HSP20 family protein